MLKRFDLALAPHFPQHAPESVLLPLSPERLERSKVAFSCRRVPRDEMRQIATAATPRAGDLVLARVAKLGHHRNLETLQGRRHLFPGDEIVVCYGDRYAPDQFEAQVPDALGPCDLVAAGGLASRCLHRHDSTKAPTALEPLGLIADEDGEILNLRRYSLKRAEFPGYGPPAIAVVGTAMNAGKTTSAAYLVRGLALAGLRVAALKVTGTGSPNDVGLFRDAGATPVLDFTDAGFASTYRCSTGQLIQIFETLLGAVATADVVVVEVADGLFQQETAELLKAPLFRDRIRGLLFAAGDAMGAVAGVQWLHQQALPVLGVSGLLTRAPLAVREFRQACDVPVFTKEALCDEAIRLAGLETRAVKFGS